MIAKGTPVVVEGGPYGVGTREQLTGQGRVRFHGEITANDGDEATYDGPHPTVPGWHLVSIAAGRSTELLAPLSEGMFRVAPVAAEGEASTTA